MSDQLGQMPRVWTIHPGRHVWHEDGSSSYAIGHVEPWPEENGEPFEVVDAAEYLRLREAARCDWPLGSSEALSVRCARENGHDGPHRSLFERPHAQPGQMPRRWRLLSLNKSAVCIMEGSPPPDDGWVVPEPEYLRLREIARQVLSDHMAGRDLASALNALEAAAGLGQQGAS